MLNKKIKKAVTISEETKMTSSGGVFFLQQTIQNVDLLLNMT